jgi:hypothetical protein
VSVRFVLQNDNAHTGDEYVTCNIKTKYVSYCKTSGGMCDCVILFIMSEHVGSPSKFLQTGIQVRSFVSHISFCHVKLVCIKLCVNVREVAHVTVELFKITLRFLQ